MEISSVGVMEWWRKRRPLKTNHLPSPQSSHLASLRRGFPWRRTAFAIYPFNPRKLVVSAVESIRGCLRSKLMGNTQRSTFNVQRSMKRPDPWGLIIGASRALGVWDLALRPITTGWWSEGVMEWWNRINAPSAFGLNIVFGEADPPSLSSFSRLFALPASSTRSVAGVACFAGSSPILNK